MNDTNPMEIKTVLKLPKCTGTEVMMDDNSLAMTEVLSRVEKFKGDEVFLFKMLRVIIIFS